MKNLKNFNQFHKINESLTDEERVNIILDKISNGEELTLHEKRFLELFAKNDHQKFVEILKDDSNEIDINNIFAGYNEYLKKQSEKIVVIADGIASIDSTVYWFSEEVDEYFEAMIIDIYTEDDENLADKNAMVGKVKILELQGGGEEKHIVDPSTLYMENPNY